jgi:hypothetical protein
MEDDDVDDDDEKLRPFFNVLRVENGFFWGVQGRHAGSQFMEGRLPVMTLGQQFTSTGSLAMTASAPQLTRSQPGPGGTHSNHDASVDSWNKPSMSMMESMTSSAVATPKSSMMESKFWAQTSGMTNDTVDRSWEGVSVGGVKVRKWRGPDMEIERTYPRVAGVLLRGCVNLPRKGGVMLSQLVEVDLMLEGTKEARWLRDYLNVGSWDADAWDEEDKETARKLEAEKRRNELRRTGSMSPKTWQKGVVAF